MFKNDYQNKKTENINLTNRTIGVGPSFSGKTEYKKKPNENFFLGTISIITRSPERYNDNFDTDQEVIEVIGYDCGLCAFDYMLDYIEKAFDPFFKEAY